jgi:hypothetical protein
LPLVPGGNQPLGILKHLCIGRAPVRCLGVANLRRLRPVPALFGTSVGQILHTVPGRGSARAGDNRMRENSEYVACPCCGEPMGLARTVSHAELPPLEMFECKPYGLAVSAEAVSGSHALIEKNYF